MTVLEQISNPHLSSLSLGLLYRLPFCASASLPYIISYIAGIGAGFKKGIIVTSIYNSGRILAYAIKGTIMGLLNKTALFRTRLSSIRGISLAVMGLGGLFNSLLVTI